MRTTHTTRRTRTVRAAIAATVLIAAAAAVEFHRPEIAQAAVQTGNPAKSAQPIRRAVRSPGFIVHNAIAHDRSAPLVASSRMAAQRPVRDTVVLPKIVVPEGAAAVEQRTQGRRAPAKMVANFAGLGADFVGPQGNAMMRNPSDNSLAVGPDRVVQIVNSRMAVFTKTGTPLYGPVPTNNVFKGFGGACETHDNGDAVVRYDQLAKRWLIVMPIFSRLPRRENEPVAPRAGDPAAVSQIAQPGQPGAAAELQQPPRKAPTDLSDRSGFRRPRGQRPPPDSGSYAMCYAVSTGTNPLGSYYRYEFVRPLFDDYPRPAIWPDGYYVPTSTGDQVIQKQACVADRVRMLKGESATEQCLIVDNVNFLNNADMEGTQLPPSGAPDIVLAAGGTQLKKVMEDDGIYAWKYHVDWKDPSRSRLDGPQKVEVAPYHYLCDGQLTSCVPQPGTDRRLDAQGDKLMSRVVYRRIGKQQSIIASHSVNTSEGGGGVRWYEFRIDAAGNIKLYQQGTYAPDSNFRWMGSPVMDKKGNIGIGYSYGGAAIFPGQRFTGRTPGDPKGVMSLHEAVLVAGQASQTNTLRWEDYTTAAIDPSDDCTTWYVGDYIRPGETNYSTRIGAFRMPGCSGAR